MRLSDLVRFSVGGLKGHRLRTALSLLGVAIGVASVVMLTSLGEGARLYVVGEFAQLGSNLLILIPGKTETFGGAPMVSTAPNDLTVDDVERVVRAVPLVRRAAPLALGLADASYGEKSRSVTVVGTTHDMLEVRKLRMSVGRFLPDGVRDAPVAVIGAKVQRELFGNRTPLGETIRIGEWRFRVIGVIAPRGTSVGMNLDEVVEVPVDTALRLFNRTSLFRVLCEVSSHARMDEAREAVLGVLKERHDGEEDVTAITQDALLATFEQILRVLTLALAGIAAISLSVAGIGIMNVMLVSVAERTREVGLLKALGVTRRQVVAVFLLEASILSTAGGLLGLAAGLGGGRLLQHFVPAFPVQPPWWAVVTALLVSLTVGLAFGSLPARRAAALDPVLALMRRRG